MLGPHSAPLFPTGHARSDEVDTNASSSFDRRSVSRKYVLPPSMRHVALLEGIADPRDRRIDRRRRPEPHHDPARRLERADERRERCTRHEIL